MPSHKQLVINTLRDLAYQCVLQQIRLKLTSVARRAAEADEAAIKQRIEHIRAKVNRELTVNAELLGVKRADEDEYSA